ncbi:MAG: hypothetical protein H7837_06850 [Magnetococcus sp. MYC-9]
MTRVKLSVWLSIVLCLSGVGPVGAAPIWVDRSERQPGDRDRGDGFVAPSRHPPKGRELEPGDAAGSGDFTQTGPLDKEVEPADREEGRLLERRQVAPRRGLQNSIQEVPVRTHGK